MTHIFKMSSFRNNFKCFKCQCFQPKISRNTTVVDQFEIMSHCNEDELTLHGTVGCLSIRQLSRVIGLRLIILIR